MITYRETNFREALTMTAMIKRISAFVFLFAVVSTSLYSCRLTEHYSDLGR